LAARSRSRPFGAIVGLAALLASCTLTRTKVDSCKANADCRDAFGSGLVCSPDGLCERAPPNPRCTRTFPDDLLTRPESYPNAILIGSLFVSTVEAQAARERAVRLAATQVNEQQGLDGRSFGIVFCDIAEDAKFDSLKRTDAAVASARYLVDVIGVPAIVGPSASGDAVAVFGAVKNDDVLVISPSATSPELTAADVVPTATDERPGLLWRTAVPDTVQGSAIARHLDTIQPPVTNVTVIHERGAYGDGLERVFRAAYQRQDRTIRSIGYDAGNSGQRDAAIQDGASGPPQYVLFFSSQAGDMSAFVKQVFTNKAYDPVQLFLTDTAANKDLLNQAAIASAVFPRISGSRPALPQGPVYDLFRASYISAHNQDPNAFTFVPHAYDAAWLTFYGVAYALRVEQQLRGSGIARGLRRVASEGELVQVSPANWKRISDDVSSNRLVNLAGASGGLDFDLATEETTGAIDIWKISADGQTIEQVSTIQP